jgi:putative transposase
MKSITRTDKWRLAPTPLQLIHLDHTVTLYRRYVRDLVGLVYVHWPQLGALDEEAVIAAVERLMHPTAQRPCVRYEYFRKHWHKFPSYYRRVAIREAVGQVSSFVTRYVEWQSGMRERREAKPPRLVRVGGYWPSLYAGQCIRMDGQQQCEIKVHNGSDWVWITVPIASIPVRARHDRKLSKRQSPMLIVRRGRAHLSVPYKLKVEVPRKGDVSRVVGVDLGLNTAAVASVIDSEGTVTRRLFMAHAVDMDSRDRRLARIRKKARLTMGSGGKLSRGFARGLYRKARNINENMAQHISRRLVSLAQAESADAIVFEHLKGWRPRGGPKRSALRQRFHGWLHRRIVHLTTEKAVESGVRVDLVPPRGTSSYAFDGSGKVNRDKNNHALATFASGKQYNADLGASYNIGARFWTASGRKRPKSTSGRSPGAEPRTPATLSTLWRQ